MSAFLQLLQDFVCQRGSQCTKIRFMIRNVMMLLFYLFTVWLDQKLGNTFLFVI